MKDIPDRDSFVSGPRSAVCAVAPATVIYTPGGTRRAAARAGIDPSSEGYPEITRRQMLGALGTLFSCGVSHAFTGMLRAHRHQSEDTWYREHMYQWLADGLASDDALADFRALGWRVRMVGGASIPELAAIAARLEAHATPEHYDHTVWFFVDPTPDAAWRAVIDAAQAGATSQADVIRFLYGEAIPPATLLLAFGKPILGSDLYPPAIAGEMNAYWTQRPGFTLDEVELRHIIYDAVYTRATRAQGVARYAEASRHGVLWDHHHIIGIGERIGGFWYPASDEVFDA